LFESVLNSFQKIKTFLASFRLFQGNPVLLDVTPVNTGSLYNVLGTQLHTWLYKSNYSYELQC